LKEKSSDSTRSDAANRNDVSNDDDDKITRDKTNDGNRELCKKRAKVAETAAIAAIAAVVYRPESLFRNNVDKRRFVPRIPIIGTESQSALSGRYRLAARERLISSALVPGSNPNELSRSLFFERDSARNELSTTTTTTTTNRRNRRRRRRRRLPFVIRVAQRANLQT